MPVYSIGERRLRFLRDGDRVRCEGEGLGAIENLVREQ